MKTKSILIAAVMFLALSVSAFAQAQFTVSSTPVTTVVATGLTEKMGDLMFQYTGPNPVVTGTISIILPPGVKVTDNGRVAEDVVTNTGFAVTSTIGSNTLVVAVPAQPGGATNTVFRLTQVRVAVAGTGLTSMNINLTGTGNTFVAGQTLNIPVISAISDGIATVTAGTAVQFNAIQGLAAPATVNLTVTENFNDAFGVVDNAGVTAGVNYISTLVKVKIPSVPTGVTLTFPATVGTFFTRADSTGATAAGTVTLTANASAQYVFYRVTTDTNLLAIDSLVIPITVATTAQSLPTTVTAQASLAINNTTDIYTPNTVPRYVEKLYPTEPVVIVRVLDSTTMLLIPYATDAAATMDGFETAIAIANTTKDPGLANTGFAIPIAQNGAIKFYFYPSKGTAFSYTTDADAPGLGLTAGVLNSGDTYIVRLEELLAKTTWTGDFNGYIFIVTNFTNAHGEYFVTDWENFTHGALMPVVVGARNVIPESLAGF